MHKGEPGSMPSEEREGTPVATAQKHSNSETRDALVHFEDSAIGERREFVDFLSQRVDSGEPPDDYKNFPIYSIERRRALLKEHGITTIDARSIPWEFARNAEKFSKEDWEFIRTAPHTLLAAYTVNNALGRWEYDTRFRIDRPNGMTVSRDDDPELTASLTELPLVYATSADALDQILRSGKILSNREYIAQQMASGKDPNSIEWLEQSGGHTFGADREAGLDNYVFTHFGRPPSDESGYGNVQILLKQDCFFGDPRGFATEDDFIDLVDAGQVDQYRDQIIQGIGPYFLRAASARIKNYSDGRATAASFLSRYFDRKNNMGQVFFSTWEVKIPEASTSDIAAIVFTDLDELRAFQKKHETLQCARILDPSVKTLRPLLKTELGFSDAVIDYTPREYLKRRAEEFLYRNPEKQTEYFGDADVRFHPEEIYRLPRNERVYDERLRAEYAKNSADRLRRLAALPDEETTVTYLQLRDAEQRKFIQSGTHLNYLDFRVLDSMGKQYTLEELLRYPREAATLIKVRIAKADYDNFIIPPVNKPTPELYCIEDIIDLPAKAE